MDYGEVFTTAGRLIWKHKILWLFGLLAGCAAGGSPNLNYSLNGGELGNFSGQLPAPLQNFLFNLQQMLRQTPGYFFVLALLLVCGVGIVFWLIGMYGRTGLARGAWLADGGAEPLAFSPLASESTRSFGRVALGALLTGLPGFAVGLISALLIFFGVFSLFSDQVAGLGVAMICLAVPMFCVLVPIFWLLGVWGELSTVAIVNENLGVIDGLKRGWHFIRSRIGSVLLFALLLFIAQIAFGILVGLLFAPLGLGVILGSVVTRGDFNLNLGLVLLALLILLPIALFLSGVFHSYVGTVWTLVFRRLAAAEARPAAPASPFPPTQGYPPQEGFPPAVNYPPPAPPTV